MGLDMYLSARKYVSDYNYEQGKTKEEFDSILDAVGLTRGQVSEDSPSIVVNVNIAYWRKANAIHNWFIENVAGGEDDCQPFYVGRDELVELHKTLCKLIQLKAELSNGEEELHEALDELLPTQSGFFFGGTDYDEWYWENLTWTERRLASILEDQAFADFEFQYRASW